MSFLIKISIFILVIFNVSLVNSRSILVDYSTSNSHLYMYISKTNNIDVNILENQLKAAILENSNNEFSKHNMGLFILLARLSPNKGIEYADMIIENHNAKSYIYNIALEWLAMNGKPKHIKQLLKKHAHFRYIWALAKGGEYHYAENYINDILLNNKTMSQYSISPFLDQESPFREQLIKKIIDDVDSNNSHLKYNMLNIILNNQNIWTKEVVDAVNQSILNMLSSADIRSIKAGLKFVLKWGYIKNLPDEINSKLIELIYKNPSIIFNKLIREVSKKLLLSNKSNSHDINADPQSLNWVKPIVTQSGSGYTSDNLIEIMKGLEYSKMWILLSNDLNSEEIILLLNSISKDNIDKIQHIQNLALFKNGTVAMKINAIKNININESILTKNILLELFQHATTIEKTSLILLYPTLFDANVNEMESSALKYDNWIQVGVLENIVKYFDEKKPIDEDLINSNKKRIQLLNSKLNNLIKKSK